jgi:hypothetical protein
VTGTSHSPGEARRFDLLLAGALAGQAALLVPRIGLLPVWGDEQFTLNLIRAPSHAMLDLLRDDFHPPLYFLLVKLWVWLVPGPTLVDTVRLASVALALLATVAVDRLWLRELAPRLRRWFLVLWVLSPILLLYGRMARSYTAQLLVATIATRYAVDWLARPRLGAALRFALAESVLLYVHYLPGLALGGGFGFAGLCRIARGERERLRSFAIAVTVCAALYLPWAASLATTIVRRVGDEAPRIGPSAALDHLVRIGYTFLSFTFGETMPWFGLLLAAVLGPPTLWLLGHGLSASREWLWIVLPMLPLAYLVAAKHVVLAMTPSRLLFLLPFHLLLLVHGSGRRPRLAAVVLPALVVTSLLAASSYHRLQGFLNKGYLLPVGPIAARAGESLTAPRALLVIDVSNMDATALLAALPRAVPALTVSGDAAVAVVSARIEDDPLDRVWLLRQTHDVSAAGWSSRMAAELGRALQCVRRSGFVPYDPVDRLAMRLFGWPERPEHVLELLEFERPPSGAAPPPAGSLSCRGDSTTPR